MTKNILVEKKSKQYIWLLWKNFTSKYILHKIFELCIKLDFKNSVAILKMY